ncbi:MAG: hypothetical protein PHX38_08900 [Sulfuricella sp.]|nr:hypothetical protein [Sulfuricella sp.]
MKPDKRQIHAPQEAGQAALLLERLETLRSELGAVGEDLIALLREAGAAPPAESVPVRKNKARCG